MGVPLAARSSAGQVPGSRRAIEVEVEVRDLLGLVGVVRDPDGDDVLVGEQVGEIGPQRLGQGTVQGGEGLIDEQERR